MVTTVQAFETLRPAPFEQRLKALFHIAIEFAELPQTEAFLNLNLIALHRNI